MISNSRVLVTGGAGFIGSNLVESLLHQNNEVICLDNLSTGKKENINEFIANKHFKFIEADIRDLKECQKACDCIDFVLHQAALGSVPRSIKDPISSAQVNIMGTLNMFVAARDAKVKRFVYASSSSVYGSDETLPKVENKIGKPLSPYAVTKNAVELFAENFFRLYGMEIIGLRYFNVFGKKQDPFGAYAAVIPRFISALIKRESPVINGDGTISRDFTFVDNVVFANQLAALVPSSELKTQNITTNMVFNIACGHSTSINDLFSMIRTSLSQYDGVILGLNAIHGPNRLGEILHSNADISQAIRYLGYEPKYNIAEGLHETIKWYRSSLSK